MSTSAIERVEETARWIALARALESERKDAVFHDPFGRRLAGSDVAHLHALIGRLGGTWPLVARTYLIDALLGQAVHDGADCVLNLAAGLDSRPYRLDLPASLHWIEVDHEHVLAAKTEALRNEQPRCQLERKALDLARREERLELFASLRGRFQRIVVVTEGLLCYLSEDAALELARDLLQLQPLRWITDLHNYAVVRFIEQRSRAALQGTARMQFASDNGPAVFEPLGWKVLGATSHLKTAARLGRLSFPMSWLARLPEQKYGSPKRPWTGTCVLEPAGVGSSAP